MCICVLLLAALTAIEAPSGDIPEILVRAHLRRSDFKTAQFKYTFESEWPGEFAPRKENWEARMAGNDIYWINRGDDDGIVMKHPRTGVPCIGAVHACTPRHTIRDRSTKEDWFKVEDDGVLYVGRSRLDPFLDWDPRSVGLNWIGVTDTSPEGWLAQCQQIPAKWRERVVNGIHEITRDRPPLKGAKSHRQVVWRVDPAMDDAITSVTAVNVFDDGRREVVGEVKNEYQLVDGHWWLERSVSFAPITRSKEVVTFHHAEFDRPEHPKALGPELFGMPSGVMTVDQRNLSNENKQVDVGHYGGGRAIIPADEWKTARYQYDLEALAEFQRTIEPHGDGKFPRWWNADENTHGLERVTYDPDLWEAYVRRWILRHSSYMVQPIYGLPPTLDDEQVNAAWAILKDCRRRAKPILRRMHEEERAGPKSQTVGSRIEPPASQPSTPPAKSSTLGAKTGTIVKTAADEASTKPSKYDSELEQIFDLLKRRLNGLLREKQKLADEKPGAELKAK